MWFSKIAASCADCGYQGDETCCCSDKSLRYALSYAAQGFRVIPLGKLSKKPLLKRWPTRGTTDRETITKWFEAWPESNIGILTGGGLIALDVDPRNGGRKSLRKLLRRRRLPTTAEALTGAGGSHYLFWVDPVLRVANQALLPGLEVKGESGVIVVEPSVHPGTRREYVWLRTPQQSIAQAPAWLLSMLKTGDLRQRSQCPSRPIDPTREGEVGPLLAEAIERFPVREQGERHMQMVRLVGRLLGKGYNPELAEAVVAVWWEHFYDSGTIGTSLEEGTQEIGWCIKSTLGNPNFRRAVGADHLGICAEIPLNYEQNVLIDQGLACANRLLLPHTPCISVTGLAKLCRTAKEKAFVEALIVYFAYKTMNLKESPLKATNSQFEELVLRRSGLKLHRPEIERLKARYVTRPDQPASRFELLVQTFPGRPSIPSEYELTGLWQLIEPDEGLLSAA